MKKVVCSVFATLCLAMLLGGTPWLKATRAIIS
jgi:hypothetical protein